MKMKFIALFLALMLALSAAACGTQSVNDSSTEISENVTEPESLETLEADVMKDVERVEAFYTKACTDSSLLGICLMEHAVAYADFIMNSDTDFDDKYDDLDELYDVVYENAEDEFYDGIYDGILDDMYDIFYDELLDDAYDSVSYEKWFDARTNEYEWWADARSDYYEIWFDTRSDIYEFWFDLRSATYEKDAEKVEEIIALFKGISYRLILKKLLKSQNTRSFF